MQQAFFLFFPAPTKLEWIHNLCTEQWSWVKYFFMLIHASIDSSIHSFIYPASQSGLPSPSIICSYIRPSIHPSVHSSIHLLIHHPSSILRPIDLSVIIIHHPPILPSVQSSIYPTTCCHIDVSTYSHNLVCLHIHLPVMASFIPSSIHPPTT